MDWALAFTPAGGVNLPQLADELRGLPGFRSVRQTSLGCEALFDGTPPADVRAQAAQIGQAHRPQPGYRPKPATPAQDAAALAAFLANPDPSLNDVVAAVRALARKA